MTYIIVKVTPWLWCIKGHCKSAILEFIILCHGGWSGWRDGGRGSCVTECVPCQISGQIKVRRSIRICDNL
ncbi:unnamed protein product [Brugia pahangi]|uniref:Secreted protein n=1 Tax=Brugia pahangi TaxID=6280 RepID=A0A0N4TJC6_BRUPA|nr:unnamed protein product [Brugia pahangi]